MLQRAYEQMIVQAQLNPTFGKRLVSDPRQAALSAGFSPMVAESLVGLRAGNLADFAAALHRRVYGTAPERSAGAFRSVHQSAETTVRRTGTIG